MNNNSNSSPTTTTTTTTGTTAMSSNSNTLTAYTTIIIVSDVSSFLIRLLLCVGMLKCERKCHPFDVSCIIVANLSFNYGLTSWLVEYAVEAIPLAVPFGFICYLINARQIFWILSNHSLVFLSFNRVYLIHRSICMPGSAVPSSASSKQSCLSRWAFSIVFHSLNFGLLVGFQLAGYLTNSVVFYNWSNCSKSTKSYAYKQVNYFLRNLVPCLAMAVNYVLVVPIYFVWHLRQSRARKSSTDEMNEKRVNRVIKLSLMHFVYTIFQASSWLILTGVTEFVLKYDTIPPPPSSSSPSSLFNSTTLSNSTSSSSNSTNSSTSSSASSSSNRPVTMFELFFGTLNNMSLLGAWWLELFAWLYMILDSFNPLILIFLHTHLHRSIVEILSFWRDLFVKYPKSLYMKISRASSYNY